MVNRFPHVLKYTFNSSETGPIQAANGDLAGPTPVSVLREGFCRAQPNERASYIIAEQSGDRIEFSYVIFLNKTIAPIPVGQKVEVFLKTQLIYTGTVKRFHTGQLHSRLWI